LGWKGGGGLFCLFITPGCIKLSYVSWSHFSVYETSQKTVPCSLAAKLHLQQHDLLAEKVDLIGL